MSTDKGYVKIYRDIRDHWVWHDKPFSRGQAWIDLILLANHEAKTIMINGIAIPVKKGQHLTSVTILSERWGWSRGKVKRFLDVLENEHMINTKRNGNGTLLSLEKYSFYQGVRNGNRNNDGTATERRRNADGHKQDTIEDTIEDTKKKTLPPADDYDPLAGRRRRHDDDL